MEDQDPTTRRLRGLGSEGLHGDPAPAPVLDVRVGRFRLRRQLGSGGMGTVYEAEQEQPRRRVAVKVLNTLACPPAALRFEQESQHLARLRHRNIAAVIEAGTHRHLGLAVPYYAMELVADGLPVTTYAEQHGLSVAQRVRLFLHVCEAAHHAHAQNVIHRDLKPGNILVDADGQPKLIDFGIARALDAARDLTLTEPSQLLGTLQYISPEQLAPEPPALDCRADVYALGLVLYELLCGRRPYDLTRATIGQATRVVREQPVPPPRKLHPSISADVETVLLKALQKDRDRRYASAAELAEDLRRALSGEAVHARRDSRLYRLRVGVRRVVGRQWVVATVLTVIAAVFSANQLKRFGDRFHLTHALERLALVHVPFFPTGPMEHVVVVAINDETDLEGLARAQGLDGASVANPTGMRRLHARFFGTLVDSGAKVLASNVTFSGQGPYDDELVKAVQALRQAGTAVVLTTPRWRQGLDLSPAIRNSVAWGDAGVFVDPHWETMFAVAYGGGATVPSFALAAGAAYRWPDRPLGYELALKGVDVYAGEERHLVPASNFLKYNLPSVPGSIATGDYVSLYVLQVPSDVSLRRSTLEYGQVLRAGPAQRAQWFANKAVMLADCRVGKAPVVQTPDGRRVHGVYAHALAMEGVIAGRAIHRPYAVQMLGGTISSSILIEVAGAIATVVLSLLLRDRRTRMATIAGFIITIPITALVVFRSAGFLYAPHTPMLAVAAAAVLGCWVRRCRAAGVA